MSIPPLSTSSVQDPTSTANAFTFPGTPTDHPATVKLEHDEATTLKRHDDVVRDDVGPKHHHSLGHRRPHLHISQHLHRHKDGDPTTNQGVSQAHGEDVAAELLKVPETKTPRARSLDTAIGGSKAADATESPREDETEVMDDKKDGSISAPRGDPIDAAASSQMPDGQPTIGSAADGKPVLADVWDEIRYERDSRPGVTPLILTEKLTTLQSLTRSHTLKLAGARRTIEHRVAEWAILLDKLETLDADAADLGRTLIGGPAWTRLSTNDADSPTTAQDDPASPVKTLEALQANTRHAEQTLDHLATTVSKRKADVANLRGKVQADGLALERRMGRGLERKMEAIEKAEADAKRRDLIINIVTFTALIVIGALLTKIVLQLSTSTGRWSVVVGKDWVKAAVELAREGFHAH
ncbi:hypothetical protein NliqN6_4578 [Naganishia liquefaciens]|uniref:Uncharacterized protein n=1 Tax=Naganishia liquefaciens TaxID=104408 RepID=A0A8H3TWH3_9TREE|nr:hypothetical protein NliqN6_4578 [Naganishia liquefaciens]